MAQVGEGGWRRVAGFAVLYAVAVFIGRWTRLPDSNMALVAPAVGVGLLWMYDRTAKQLLAQGLLLGSISAVVLIATGTGAPLDSVWIAGCHVINAVVAALVLARLTGRGELRLRTPADLGQLVASAIAGAVVATVCIAPVMLDGSDRVSAGLAWLATWCLRSLAGGLFVPIVWVRLAEAVNRAELARDLRRAEFGCCSPCSPSRTS